MKDVVAGFESHHLGKSKEQLSKVLDAEVQRFSRYMESIADPNAKGPLSNPEAALVKSYLVAKLTGKLDGE